MTNQTPQRQPKIKKNQLANAVPNTIGTGTFFTVPFHGNSGYFHSEK
jgi:hypothetical protein